MHLNPSSFVRISFTQSTHSVMQGDSNKHNAIWSCLQLETFFTQLWEKKKFQSIIQDTSFLYRKYKSLKTYLYLRLLFWSLIFSKIIQNP